MRTTSPAFLLATALIVVCSSCHPARRSGPISTGEARTLWASHDIHDYELEMSQYGPMGRSDYLVVVENDSVVNIVDEHRGGAEPASWLRRIGSVDGMFRYLDTLQSAPEWKLAIVFDSHYGIPVRVYIEHRSARDIWIDYTVLTFKSR